MLIFRYARMSLLYINLNDREECVESKRWHTEIQWTSVSDTPKFSPNPENNYGISYKESANKLHLCKSDIIVTKQLRDRVRFIQ